MADHLASATVCGAATESVELPDGACVFREQ